MLRGHRIPKRTRRRSGWLLIGRCIGREYYAIVDPQGEPQGIYRTKALALAAIRRHETAPLLERAK